MVYYLEVKLNSTLNKIGNLYKMSNELREYLESLYQQHDSEDIDSFLNNVMNHDTNKLPPTQIVLDYIECKTRLKEIELKEKELRAKVIEQYKKLNHQFSGLSISTPSPRKYDRDLLYDWVKEKYDPTFLEDCTSELIDKEKVEQKIVRLIIEEKIKQEDLPESLYKESSQTRIEISGSRKRKPT